MQSHTIKPGECLLSIAKQFNFVKWEDIFFHLSNDRFREKSPDPECPIPGETIFIPEKTTKAVPAGGKGYLPLKLKRSKAFISMQFKDDDGKALSNIRFELFIDGEKADTPTEKTDEDGRFSYPLLPSQVSAKNGKIKLFLKEEAPVETIEIDINIGQKSSRYDTSGQQARLANANIPCGKIDGEKEALTIEAIKEFQASKKMEETGEVCPTTAEFLHSLA